jgi:hypothetical protein
MAMSDVVPLKLLLPVLEDVIYALARSTLFFMITLDRASGAEGDWFFLCQIYAPNLHNINDWLENQ